MHAYSDSDPVVQEWEAILQSHDLGLYRGLRLGQGKLIYCGFVHDNDRLFSYDIRDKQPIPSPYWKAKGRPANQFCVGRVSIEHKRARWRRNKQRQRRLKKCAN